MKLGQRARLILAYAPVLALVWGGASLFLTTRLSRRLERVHEEQAASLARNLALWSEEAVLTEARVELVRLIAQTRKSNPAVIYVYVQDPQGRVLAHSFEERVPGALLAATAEREKTLLKTEEGSLLDFRAPVLSGRGGSVHLGYSRQGMLESVADVRSVAGWVFAAVMAAGILAIAIVATVLTRPAVELTQVARRLGKGDLKTRVEGSFPGEFGALAAAFNQMATRLESRSAELHSLSEYHQNLLDHLGVCLFVFDRDLRVEYQNQDATAREGDVRGRHCGEVFRCEGEPCPDCVGARALLDGRVHSITSARTDGRRLAQRAIPVRLPDEREAVVVTSRDVTEASRHQEMATRTEKLAAVGELAAAVAHEVNNPLDGMQSLIRLVLDDPGTTLDTREHLEMVRGGLQRIETCVRRLLTFAADPREARVRSEVAEQIDHALALTRSSLADSRIEVRVDIAPGMPAIHVEPDRFPQLIVTLLLSVADTVAAGGTITIGADHGAGGIRILFENRGPGAVPEHPGRLFLPFFLPKGPALGSVLGLAVSRRIAEEHGGSVRVREAPGGGAAYELQLPLSLVEDGDDQPGVGA